MGQEVSALRTDVSELKATIDQMRKQLEDINTAAAAPPRTADGTVGSSLGAAFSGIMPQPPLQSGIIPQPPLQSGLIPQPPLPSSDDSGVLVDIESRLQALTVKLQNEATRVSDQESTRKKLEQCTNHIQSFEVDAEAALFDKTGQLSLEYEEGSLLVSGTKTAGRVFQSGRAYTVTIKDTGVETTNENCFFYFGGDMFPALHRGGFNASVKCSLFRREFTVHSPIYYIYNFTDSNWVKLEDTKFNGYAVKTPADIDELDSQPFMRRIEHVSTKNVT